MKQSVQVTIFGHPYTVRSEASADEVQRVAAFVNEQINEVAGAGKTADTLNASLLALLNVAGAYLRLRDETTAQQAGLQERLMGLSARIEKACP